MHLSNYLRNALANAVLRGVVYTLPSKLYLHLYTSDPTVADIGTEVTAGTGYVPQEVTFTAAAVNGVCTNSADITFAAATGDQGVITHAGLRDALSGGNLLWFGTLTPSQVMGVGAQLVITTGSLQAGFN